MEAPASATHTRVYRALLVDDSVELRELMRMTLELSKRFEVVGEAGDGTTGVDAAGDVQPDVVLLDISMPQENGLDVLPRVRIAVPDAKVVVLSGFEAAEMAQRALQRGADDYIEKGLPPKLLIHRLLAILDGEGEIDPGGGAGEEVASPTGESQLQEMLAVVAHEIKNPLVALNGMALLLRENSSGLSDEQRALMLDRIVANGRYLENVVSTVFQLRAIEGGYVALNLTSEDPPRIMDALADELREIADGHPLDLRVDDELPMVQIDVARLRQVLTNLVVNAAKFSPPAAAIRVRCSRAENGVIIEVCDEGPGIPKKERERVFEKFTQLDKGRSGLGLGLYIARLLMRAMGGDVYVRPSLQGACLCCRVVTASGN